MSTTWIPTVPTITDGVTKVSGDAINPIIDALAQRSQYLYEQLAAVNNRSVLVAIQQDAPTADIPQHSVVCWDGVSAQKGLRLADPKIDTLNTYPYFKAANSSYAFGITKTSSAAGTADVYLSGLIENATALLTHLLDDTTAQSGFTTGPLYLSKTPGKLSATPGGLAIFIGFAFDGTTLYLNPKPEVLTEFFWNFKYTVLPRPASAVMFNGGIWEFNDDTDALTKVGWVYADKFDPEQEKQPGFGLTVRPKYFFNVPDRDTIAAENAELSDFEVQQAVDMDSAFPTRPNALAMLTVNGIVLPIRQTADDEGVYMLNQYGLWWFANLSGAEVEINQPWASDIMTTLPIEEVIVASGTPAADDQYGLLKFTGHGFVTGDTIAIFLDPANTCPTGLNDLEGPVFYVVDKSITDYISLKDRDTGTPVSITGAGTASPAGSGRYVQWRPEFWAFTKDNMTHVPDITLQFVKLNPEAKQMLVTSLHPVNTTPAVKFTSTESGVAAEVGDLDYALVLPITTTLPTGGIAGEGQAIKSLSFNNTTETLLANTGSVISSIKSGGGIRASTELSTGVCTLTFSSAFSNAVSSLEPESSRLEYLGLNSYLALDFASAPSGFLGKFVLPDEISVTPGAYLNINMFMFGKGTITHPTNNRQVRFKFEYAVSKLGNVLSSAVTSPAYQSLYMPDTVTTPSASYTPYASFEPTATHFKGAGGYYLFRIPVSELAGKATVNFRISRLKNNVGESATPFYSSVVGVYGIYWTLA